MARRSCSGDLCDPASCARLVMNGWTRSGCCPGRAGLGWAGLLGWMSRSGSSAFVGLRGDYECKKTVKVFSSGRLQAAIFRARAFVMSWAARTFEVAPLFRCSSDALVPQARMRGPWGWQTTSSFREFGVFLCTQ